MSDHIKIVPALCTQCGASIEVDPDQDKATCPFCRTSFMVEKAIENYSIQQAKIDHVDNVNIDFSGSVKTVLDFVGDQMKEGREERRELRKEQAETDRMMKAGFLKIFGFMFAGMMILGIVMYIIMLATGQFDDADDQPAGTANITSETATDSKLEYFVDDGCLYIDITGKNIGKWAYQEIDSTDTELKEEVISDNGYHCCVAGSIEKGKRYVVNACFDEDDTSSDDPLFYSVIRVKIKNRQIVDADRSKIVDNLSDYNYQ